MTLPRILDRPSMEIGLENCDTASLSTVAIIFKMIATVDRLAVSQFSNPISIEGRSSILGSVIPRQFPEFSLLSCFQTTVWLILIAFLLLLPLTYHLVTRLLNYSKHTFSQPWFHYLGAILSQ